MQLPIEIWLLIFKFLVVHDVCKFRFLSKRGNSIYFFIRKEFGFDLLIDTAKKIFDVEEYYETLKIQFVEVLCRQVKERFEFSTYLLIRYSLENFLRMTTISNTFLHLFHCPRSFFSKNNCLLCSRLFVKTEIDYRIDFSILSEKGNIISQKDYDFHFLGDNKQQKDIINSDLKRCLNMAVIQDGCDFLLYFFEIQGRYFFNFFKCLVDVCSMNKQNRLYFMELSTNLFNSFLCYILRRVNLKSLNEFFEELEIRQFKHLRVINKKYKEYLRKKYES